MKWCLFIVVHLGNAGPVRDEVVNTGRFWVHPLTQRGLKNGNVGFLNKQL